MLELSSKKQLERETPKNETEVPKTVKHEKPKGKPKAEAQKKCKGEPTAEANKKSKGGPEDTSRTV